MTLDYQDIEQTMTHYELEIDAAYFHGLLSGLICAGIEDDDIDDWLPTLISKRFLKPEDYHQLSENVLAIFQTVRNKLNHDGFGFELLLPDYECSLDRRIDSMGSWCRGYLMALLDYAETAVDTLPDDCMEFVGDVEQMVDLAIDDDEPVDSLDESYVLLEEHLKVGVQLLYEHMNPLSVS